MNEVPNITEIFNSSPLNNGRNNIAWSISGLVTAFADVFFLIAGALTFFWFAWGVYQYIFAGGDKEGLSKARKRITWAIIGLLFTAISFALSQYLQTIFPVSPTGLKGLTPPP